MSSPKITVFLKYAIHTWQYRIHLRQISPTSLVTNSGFNIYPMNSGFLGPSGTERAVSLCTDILHGHYLTLCGTVCSSYASLGCNTFQAMADALRISPHSNASPQKYNKICVMLSQHASVHHTSTNVFTEGMNVWSLLVYGVIKFYCFTNWILSFLRLIILTKNIPWNPQY